MHVQGCSSIRMIVLAGVVSIVRFTRGWQSKATVCPTRSLLRAVLALLFLLIFLGFNPYCSAQEILFQTKTLGGPVYWTDYLIHNDWRIQKHERLGYFRLLDPKNRRIANGTLEECYCVFERRKNSGEIRPMFGHVVIVMHGLSGTRGLMAEMERKLEGEGHCVLNFGYASTKASIQELTVGLESVIRNLDGVQSVSLVGHSMGNLIVRHMLYRFQKYCIEPPVHFERLVMLSPPNQGAFLADNIGQFCVIQLWAGEVVNQLAPSVGWDRLNRQLAIPSFEFGIVAGGTGTQRGYFKFIPGDDDGLLSLRTYYLPGAKDYVQVGGMHALLPKNDDAIDATIKFLRCGHF